jgi:hypothetical protein
MNSPPLTDPSAVPAAQAKLDQVKAKIESAKATVSRLQADQLKKQADIESLVEFHRKEAETSLLSGEPMVENPARARKVERLKSELEGYPGAIAAARQRVRNLERDLDPVTFDYTDAVLSMVTAGREAAMIEIREALAELAHSLARLGAFDLVQHRLIGGRFKFNSTKHANLALGAPLILPMIGKVPDKLRPSALDEGEFATSMDRLATEIIGTI